MNKRQSFFGLLIAFSLFLNGCANHTPVDVLYGSPAMEQHNKPIPVMAINDGGVLTVEKGQLKQLALKNKTSQKNSLFALLEATQVKAFTADESFKAFYAVAGQIDQNIDHAFAQSLVEYILNTQFSCQQPVYYRYFQQRYAYYDNEVSCNDAVPFHILSSLDLGEIRWITPKRVSAIHLLFANSDEGLASRFGHVLIRLIVCPETDKELKQEDCERNLKEHIVLGYSAHIDEMNISTLKALKGDYRAYFYAHSFMDTYQNYAVSQFRDLRSLPLVLSPTALESLVRDLSQIHWSYAGKYKFLTQNCSTLLQHTLRYTWPDFLTEPSLQSTYLRPDSFFKAMQGSDLSANNYANDPAKAEEMGFLFPSTEPIYAKALAAIHAAIGKTLYKDVDSYIKTNPVTRYQAAVDNSALFERLSHDNYIQGAQLTLESLSVIRYENLMKKQLAYYFDKNDSKHIKEYLTTALNDEELNVFEMCIEKPIQNLLMPAKRMLGIPNATEAKLDTDYISICQSVENVQSLDHIRELIGRIDPENWLQFKLAALYWAESLNNFEQFKALKGKE